jgi:acyl-CoA synthetase (AMP-forming)/AMP-acid ligase II
VLSGNRPEFLACGFAALAAELDAFCRARIAGYKRPRRWVLVDALPQTPAGKIQKAELRRRLRDGSLAPLADVMFEAKEAR